MRRGKGEDRAIDQPVMDDQPRALDQPSGAQRQQFRVARPRADKIDSTDILHRGEMRVGARVRQREWMSVRTVCILKAPVCAREVQLSFP
ncbi:MAG: hypothetical protein ACTHKM_11130 [Tsuneonella sp.]